jgi:hypothetical protein
VPITIAEIVAAHEKSALAVEATIADCYRRIRNHADPAIFISLKEENQGQSFRNLISNIRHGQNDSRIVRVLLDLLA